MGTEANITKDSIVAASHNQLSTTLGGEVVIMNAKTGTYNSMEAVAARIWKLLQTPMRVREIQRALLNEYDVEPDLCRDDLLSFLQALERQGLIEVVNESTR